MSLFLLITVTESLVQQSSYLGRNLEILISKNMRQRYYEFSAVANESREVNFALIGHYLNKWSVNQAKQSINYGNIGQTGTVTTCKSACFIMEILTSIRYVTEVVRLQLHRKVVDAFSFKIDECLFVDCFKSQLVKMIRTPDLFIFKHFTSLVI